LYRREEMIRIAVDVMGGDWGAPVTLAACLTFLQKHEHAGLLLVGLPEAMQAQPSWASLADHPRCEVVAAQEVVGMDDPIEIALRRRKTPPCDWRSSRSRTAGPMWPCRLATRVR
jgi:glycerol-3-phosphate acyltransferase PlsX